MEDATSGKKKLIVFMPCYNAERYIAQTLDSILNQTYEKFDLLIIDDGSTDKSRDILEGYIKKDKRVKLIENRKNRGIAYTRNRGLEICDCEYLALMDADDIAPPERLEKEIQFLEEHKDIGAVGGLYQLIDSNGSKLHTSLKLVLSDAAIRANMLFFNPIANGSMMLRMEVVRKNNLRYREENVALEDYLFWSEFLKYSKINNLNYIFQFYRISETSLERKTRDKDLLSRKDYFDRIHEKLYETMGIRLSQKEKEVLKKATRDQSELTGVKEYLRFFHSLTKMQKQGKEQGREFEKELRLVCREYRHKEFKRLLRKRV